MVASHPGQRGPREQHNHGPGTFVGRDNYGPIEMVDTKTKAVLEKLSREAPALGRLLSNALRDGIISPDTVSALEFAARSINDDVANSLRIAGRNINEDVASSLRCAGENISAASKTLAESAIKFENIVARLDDSYGTRLVDHLDTIAQDEGSEAERIQRVFTLPPRTGIYWRTKARVFVRGVITGAVIIVALAVHYHWSFR
jgi:hypothetical protein